MSKNYHIFTVLFIFSLLNTGCSMLVNDPGKAYQKGIELLNEKKTKAAYKYFVAASKKAPDSAKYHWAAAQTAQNQNSAFIHTEMAWNSGFKNPLVMATLIRFSVFTNQEQRKEKMISLYNEFPDSIKTPDLKADLFSQIGESDSALSIWRSLYKANPTPAKAFRISRELYLQNKAAESLEFLENARKHKLLDAQGYMFLASLKAYEYDYAGVEEVFSETQQLGLYTNDIALEKAAFFFVSGKLDESLEILVPYLKPDPGQKDQPMNHRARINVAFIYASKNDSMKLGDLPNDIPDGSPFKNAETKFYNLLKNGASMDTATLFENIRNVQQALPSNPFINLFTARAFLKNNMSEQAVALYRRLPEIYLRSPAVITEYALALSSSGKEPEALIVLSTMHKKSKFTRMSLELFRDLTFRNNLVEKSEHAQKLLENVYGNDVQLKWRGVTLALRSGKIDSALVLLNGLTEKYPKEVQFKTAKISALILKERYDEALSLCHSGNIPPDQVIPLETQILRKQGKDAEALKRIEDALKDNRTIQRLVMYAEILMQMNKNDKAAEIYEEILDSRKSDAKEGPADAIIYNNMAWAMLQSQNPSKKLVLNAAKRAYTILPSSVNIIDTYIEALVKFGEFKECIKILENAKVAQEEPRLLFQLGLAYEKTKDLNKAVRSFKDAAALMDSTKGTLKMEISKGRIEQHINTLMAE